MLISGCRAGAPAPPPEPGRSVLYTFEKFDSESAPQSFLTDSTQFETAATDAAGSTPDSRALVNGINRANKPGKWVVQELREAPSGRKVLSQLDATNTPGRTPITWVRGATWGSGIAVSVVARSHELDGLVDLGVAWNVRDANEYMVLRADGGKGELRIEAIRRGKSTTVASTPWHFPAHQWFTLVIEQDGDQLRAGVNQQAVLNARVPAEFRSGSVGLCTFEGVTAEFDNFSVVGREMAR